MGDILSMDDVRAAMQALLDAPPPPDRLKYFATPAEMANAGWLEWFKRSYPNVDLIETRPMPPIPLARRT